MGKKVNLVKAAVQEAAAIAKEVAKENPEAS